jgi:hypothetical protein
MSAATHTRPRAQVALDRDRRHVRRSVHPGAFRRRRWPWVLGGGLALLFGLVTFQAYRIALYTAADLRSAALVLKVGPGFLVGGSPFSEEAFSRVETSIDKAVERVNNANWSFDLVGSVPLLGRPVHAAEHLVRAAAIELDSIELARRTIADITGTDGSQPLLRDGRVDLDALAAAAETLDRILLDLGRVEAEVAAVKPIPFVAETARLRTEALRELGRVRESAEVIRRGLRVLPDFFGAKGERNYLLAILNPAELHGVGGAFLSFGVVRADNGELGLLAKGDPLMLDPRRGPEYAEAPEGNPFLDEIYPVHLVNALNGPDFAEGARLASDIVRAKFGTPLDGVIAIDAVGLSYVLPAVGAVRYPDPRIVLDERNFVRYSTNAQYLLYPYPVRQAIQEAVIEQVWQRLGSAESPFALLNGVSRGLSERRVLLWSRFRPEQRLFSEKDWAGRVANPKGDYLLINHQNLGVDKLDYYLRERIRHRVRVQPNGDLDVETIVELRNGAPPDLDKPVGNNSGSQMRTLIGAFVPAGSELQGLTVEDDRLIPDGERAPDLATAYRKELFMTRLTVNPESRATAIYRYRVPRALVRTARGTEYRLLVQHQPLVRTASLTIELILPEGMSFGRLPPGWTAAGDGAVFATPLVRDLYVSVPLND